MDQHVKELHGRNEHAKRLAKAGFEILQAQGPDYDEDGNEIVYERDGKPVANPPIVWHIAYANSEEGGRALALYVADDDSASWERLGHPAVIKNIQTQARHADPTDDLTLSPEELHDLSVDAAVGVGDLSEREAEESKRGFRQRTEDEKKRRAAEEDA